MNSNEMAKIAIAALDDKKAKDIKVIDISNVSVMADYFIIANGNSNTHTKTLAEEVEFQLSQLGIEPVRREADSGNTWIILDYSDIIVHVFYKETRNFYQLERLWADGKPLDISSYLTKEN